jgi:hypothetical protein
MSLRLAVLAAGALVIGTSFGIWGGTGAAFASAGAGVPAHQWPPSAPPTGIHRGDPSCAHVFYGRPAGWVKKTTSAGPDWATVVPGQTITVTLKWNPKAFWGQTPAMTEDCVKIGSRFATVLSQEHKPGPADGTDTFTYQVPQGGTDGQQICDRGGVWAGDDDDRSWGQGQGRGQGQDHDWGWGPGYGGSDQHVETSAVLCYTILAAAAPEAPMALLFPVAGLFAGGGGLWLVWRRQNRRRSRPQPEVGAPAR